MEGWLYLSVILDLYSRLVIGWAMGHWLTVELAEQALTMALAKHDPLAELLRHSGLGSQHAAIRYQLLLTTHGITTNMSKRGSCCDNACVESFFGTFKCELVYHRHYTTREDPTRTSSSASRCSIIGSAVNRPLAMTLRPYSKRGRLWLNRVYTESREGHLMTKELKECQS